MVLLDGKTLANDILSLLQPHGSLHIILVGDNSASQKYVALKELACQKIGLSCTVHRLPAITPSSDILKLMDMLNDNPEVTGYFIQLPLPTHLDKNKILSRINPTKDIDGLTPVSPFTPAVVRGVIQLLDHYHLTFAEKNTVIINDSNLIGKPLQKIIEKRRGNVVVANEFTQNLPEISRGADFLFSATGVKDLITPEYIKPGAVVVDIGGGDVDFANVSPLCSYITPTIGGVGPMTIASLLQNLLEIR